jgi:hypothetical protein
MIPTSSDAISAAFIGLNGTPTNSISMTAVPAVPNPTNTAYTVVAGSFFPA